MCIVEKGNLVLQSLMPKIRVTTGRREEYLLQRGEGDDYRIARKKERLLNIEMGV